MQAKGRFISTLLAVNAFFGGYAFGFNSRHVLVVDPSLAPIKSTPKAQTETKPAPSFDKLVKKDAEQSKKKHSKHHRIKDESTADEKSPSKASTETKHHKKRHKDE